MENYCFFAWERSKSAALFCLCWLGLELPMLHGLLIAGQHQSKWNKHLISQRHHLSTYSFKQPIVTKKKKESNKIDILSSLASTPFSGLLQKLSNDPIGSQLSLQSTDGLETDSPDYPSARQNDRCVAKAQHMLYGGLGLVGSAAQWELLVCSSEGES